MSMFIVMHCNHSNLPTFVFLCVFSTECSPKCNWWTVERHCS